MKITSAALGTGWPAAVDMIDTTGWELGYYTIDFVDAADKNRDLNVASIVVLPSVDDVDALVLLSTNTYQAYNAWGGYSFYESIFAGDWGQMISLTGQPRLTFSDRNISLCSGWSKWARSTGGGLATQPISTSIATKHL